MCFTLCTGTCKRTRLFESARVHTCTMIMAANIHLEVCQDVRPAAGPAERQDAGCGVPRQQDLQESRLCQFTVTVEGRGSGWDERAEVKGQGAEIRRRVRRRQDLRVEGLLPEQLEAVQVVHGHRRIQCHQRLLVRALSRQQHSDHPRPKSSAMSQAPRADRETFECDLACAAALPARACGLPRRYAGPWCCNGAAIDVTAIGSPRSTSSRHDLA